MFRPGTREIAYAALSVLVISAGAGCTTAPPDGVPAAAPELSEPRTIPGHRLRAADLFLRARVALGHRSGYVAMYARDGHVVHASAAGWRDLDQRIPMTVDTRFRIASMTKPVTAAAALALWEDGHLDIDRPVADFVPSVGAMRVARSHTGGLGGEIPTEEQSPTMTVRHLLTFSSGIGAKSDTSTDLGRRWATNDIYLGDGSLKDRIDRFAREPLFEQPGTKWRYGWSADVLARVVEVAAGEPFDRFLRKRLFEPLGMTETSFLGGVPADAPLARVYTQDEAGALVPVSPRSDAATWTPGGSGLVSTAGDYMRFALMLWNRGEYGGRRILRPETVDTMIHPHLPSGVLADEGFDGLGWGFGLSVVVDADATLLIDRDRDFWWAGFYGTQFFVSPETGVVAVVLAQNQPGPYSDLAVGPAAAQALVLGGLTD